MQGPKKIAVVLLVFIVVGMGFADYWEYSKAYHLNQETFMDVVQGTALAPAQYRIGIIVPGAFLARHLHLGLRHVFTASDTFAGLVAVFTLLFLLQRSSVYRRASLMAQYFGLAAFLVLVQFYLPWITWYQRPETLPTAAILALALLLLTVRVPLRGAAGSIATALLILLLAAFQAFVRADVVFALHAGVFLLCLTRAGDSLSLPRRLQAATSVAAVLLALGVQYYLMKVVYPQATYGGSPVFELVLNFKEWARLIAFGLFIPPYTWMLVTLRRVRVQGEAPALGVVLGSIVFMGLWWCLGRVEEVRIFLPFALVLVPLTVVLGLKEWAGEVADEPNPLSVSRDA